MKNLMFLGFLLLALLSYSQDFDLKKGKIYVDGVAVAHIDKKKRVYTVSSIEETPKFTVVVKLKRLPNGESAYWYEVTSVSSNKMNEIPYESLVSAIGYEKNIVANIIQGEYPLLTKKGIDEALLKELTEGAPTGVSEAIVQRANKVEADQKAALALYKQKQIRIDKGGDIYSADDRIGKISHGSTTFASGEKVLKYNVHDLDNILVAEYIPGMGTSKILNDYVSNKIVTINKEQFTIKSGSSTGGGIEKNTTEKTVIALLLNNGYELGHQMKGVIHERRLADSEARKEVLIEKRRESSNIYNEPGFVIDDDGKKWEGILSSSFEEVKLEDSHAGIADLTTYGKAVHLQYKNKKGKTKKASYKSKKGVRFCIENGDCYLGLKTEGNLLNVATNVTTLSLDFSQFYKILYENEGYLILIDPTSDVDYVLKTPSQKKGLYINRSNILKVKEDIIEYIGVRDFNIEQYDLELYGDLVKIMDEARISEAK